MRALITGVGYKKLNEVAQRWLPGKLTSEKKYNVITSFQAHVEAWQQFGQVKTYVSLGDFKNPTDQGLITEVLAAAFYTKPWVQTALANSQDLVVLSTSPNVCKNLDWVVINKVTARDKIGMFHACLVDSSKMTLKAFTDLMLSLQPDEYLVLDKDRIPRRAGETKSAAADSKSRASPAAPVGGAAQSSRHHTKIQKADSQKSLFTPASAKKVPSGHPTQELWVTVRAADLKTAMKPLAQLFQNPLIKSRCRQVHSQQHADKTHVDIYVRVLNQHADMLTAFLVAQLRALRLKGVITRGCVSV